LFAEVVLTDTAQRTLKVLRQIFKLRAGSDAVLGRALCLVVFPTANVSYIFFHI
jgi:hypothetical protein